MLWAAKAEFTLSSLVQSPWKKMERITGSGKSCVRPKQKLDSEGDFPWSCRAPGRLYPSEHSPCTQLWREAGLLNTEALICTLLRLMETRRNFCKVRVDTTDGKSEVRLWGFFLGWGQRNRDSTAVCWTPGSKSTASWLSPAFCSFAMEQCIVGKDLRFHQ